MDNNTLTGTMDKVKGFWNDFDLQKWSHKIGGTPTAAEAIQAGIYFCISFGIGYFLKKYFKTIILSLLISAIIIKGMEYYKLLEIDWNVVKNLLGVTPDKKDPLTLLLQNLVEWIKNNVIIAIASFVGFILGYRIG